MNYAIAGKPGDGKGLLAMRLLIHDLVKADRCFVTNLCVEKNPWVTGNHEPRRGLLDYVRSERRGKDYDASERIFRLTDEAMANFFLYRGLSRKRVAELGAAHLVGYRQVTPLDGVLHESEWQFHKNIQLYVADHQTTELKNGRKVVTTWDTRLALASGGHWICTDEAWKNWPARGWGNTGEGVLYYYSMVRRFGDSNYVISQRLNDVDSILMDRCQEFMVCKNLGRLRMGVFRQLPIFVVSIYDHRPTPSSEPSYRKPFQLDAKGLAGCYDTSGGIGVSGRVMADIGRKSSGLPMWIIPIAVALVVVGLVFGVKYGSHVIRDLIAGVNKKPAIAAVSNSIPVVASVVSPSAGQTLPPVPPVSFQPVANPGAVSSPSNEVFCVAWTLVNQRPTVILSNGDEFGGSEIQAINKNSVVVNGVKYRVAKGQALSSWVPPRPDFVPQSPPSFVAERSVNDVIVLPALTGNHFPNAPVQRLDTANRMRQSQASSQTPLQYGSN